MATKTINYEKRQKNLNLIKEIYKNPEKYLIIHYSCESFKRESNKSPRITSIAIRNLETAQTELFSIYQIAEIEKIPENKIVESYDKLEKKLLDNFYNFLKNKTNYKFIHWNMRDENYGFQAIEHRYKVLGGTPPDNIINDDRKIDLARMLVGLYGINYIGHPRLENLIKLNNITNKNFLTGEQEAIAFENCNFLKLQRSTLRKVDCMCNILDRVKGQYLKTLTSYWDLYFSSLAAFVNFIKEHTLFSIAVILVTTVGAFTIIVNIFKFIIKILRLCNFIF